MRCTCGRRVTLPDLTGMPWHRRARTLYRLFRRMGMDKRTAWLAAWRVAFL